MENLKVELESVKQENERLRLELQNADLRMRVSARLIAIGQLVAGVAHELNNPLSVILGFAQSLGRQDGSTSATAVSGQSIEREAQRCKRLIQDLLNFSREPRSGFVKEDIIQVLEGTLSLIETQARVRRVEVVREYADPLPMAYLDRHKIQQMLINLCTNAIDAMPEGGSLTVGVDVARDSGESATLRIRVTDTGIGMSHEIRDKIFDPFFTTKDPGKGTGLGLCLVKDIVKDHQGRLEVLSREGEGSTFMVYLPVNLQPTSSGVTDPAQDRLSAH